MMQSRSTKLSATRAETFDTRYYCKEKDECRAKGGSNVSHEGYLILFVSSRSSRWPKN